MYYITLFVLCAFAFSFWRDNRSLWNPALLIISLVCTYFSIAHIFYRLGNEAASDILFVAGFVLLPFLLFLSGFFLIYNGIVLLKREGRSKANYLSLAFGFLILFFFFLIYIRAISSNGYFYEHPLWNILYLFLTFSYLLFGLAFAGFMLYSIVYLFIPKRKGYDFIVIHGAGLLEGEFVTPLLKRRIDKAVEAYRRSVNPRVKLIASGGQGADEKISEAQAIFRYLTQDAGVDEKAILLEDKSRTTYENLLFSKQLGEKRVENPQFLFVTNDYHVFRTSAYARQIGMKGDGLGCRTASYYIPSAFIREYVALCVRLKWLFIAFYALFFIMLFISYRGILW